MSSRAKGRGRWKDHPHHAAPPAPALVDAAIDSALASWCWCGESARGGPLEFRRRQTVDSTAGVASAARRCLQSSCVGSTVDWRWWWRRWRSSCQRLSPALACSFSRQRVHQGGSEHQPEETDERRQTSGGVERASTAWGVGVSSRWPACQCSVQPSVLPLCTAIRPVRARSRVGRSAWSHARTGGSPPTTGSGLGHALAEPPNRLRHTHRKAGQRATTDRRTKHSDYWHREYHWPPS